MSLSPLRYIYNVTFNLADNISGQNIDSILFSLLYDVTIFDFDGLEALLILVRECTQVNAYDYATRREIGFQFGSVVRLFTGVHKTGEVRDRECAENHTGRLESRACGGKCCKKERIQGALHCVEFDELREVAKQLLDIWP